MSKRHRLVLRSSDHAVMYAEVLRVRGISVEQQGATVTFRVAGHTGDGEPGTYIILISGAKHRIEDSMRPRDVPRSGRFRVRWGPRSGDEWPPVPTLKTYPAWLAMRQWLRANPDLLGRPRDDR